MHLLFIFYFLCVCVFLCGVCMGHDMPRLRPCESFEAGSPGPQHHQAQGEHGLCLCDSCEGAFGWTVASQVQWSWHVSGVSKTSINLKLQNEQYLNAFKLVPGGGGLASAVLTCRS